MDMDLKKNFAHDQYLFGFEKKSFLFYFHVLKII